MSGNGARRQGRKHDNRESTMDRSRSRERQQQHDYSSSRHHRVSSSRGGGPYRQDRHRHSEPNPTPYPSQQKSRLRGAGRRPADDIDAAPRHYKRDGIQVVTNLFGALECNDPSAHILQYEVQIQFAKSEEQLDADGNPVEVIVPMKKEDGQIVLLNDLKLAKDSTFSTPLSREVLLKLQSQIGKTKKKIFVTDGSGMAYATEHISEQPAVTFEVSLSKRKHFLVRFEQVGSPILLHEALESLKHTTVETDDLKRVLQFLNTLTRNVFFSRLDSFGRDFFLKEEEHTPHILGKHLHGKYRQFYVSPSSDYKYDCRSENMGTPYYPLMGLLQLFRCFSNGNCCIKADARPSFFIGTHQMLLTKGSGPAGSIAGIEIHNLKNYVPESLRKAIENALMNLRFDIVYKYCPKGTGETITFERQNRRAVDILWGADDPGVYSFQRGDETFTVQSYYQQVKGVELRYPRMPIVGVRFRNSDAYFPIEFLIARKRKMHGLHNEESLNALLRDLLSYHDEFSSKAKIDHIGDIGASAMLGVNTMLKQVNLSCHSEPMKVTARLISKPTLKTSDAKDLNIRNGSWRFAKKQTFFRPSDLNSFAIIQFGQDKEWHRAKELINEVLRFMKDEHGMEWPYHADTDSLTEIVQDVEDNPLLVEKLDTAFENAIKKAKNFYLTKECFLTKVIKNGISTDCLIVRRAIVLPPQECYSTHELCGKDSEKKRRARIMARVKGRVYDLWSLREKKGYGLNEIEHFVYRLEGETEGCVLEEGDLCKCDPLVPFDEREIECPALVFVIMPKVNKEQYSTIKFLSQFRHGVPTQCLCTETYQRQVQGKHGSAVEPRQYLSNIALKLNTKLFSHSNLGRAWETTYHDQSAGEEVIPGVPWVNEMPTMVLGFVLSHAPRRAFSSVVGTVTLDEGCMQCAHELVIQEPASHLICSKAVIKMTKRLATQFKLHTGVWPLRVLVYRDGVDDGKFGLLEKVEIEGIRRAFVELKGDSMKTCPNRSMCKGNGCFACTPLITYVVCQNYNNVLITPDVDCPSYRGNVQSGTCVDEAITPLVTSEQAQSLANVPKANTPGFLLSDVDKKGYDFYLTAQAGLKGTSKAVLYRVLRHENAMCAPKTQLWKGTLLTKRKLEVSTFHMCHQYGSATKAIRSVPVIAYGRKLAQLAVDYGRLYKQTVANRGEKISKMQVDPDPEAGEKYTSHIWMREDGETAMLPKFGPNDTQEPFRPHFMA